VSALVLVGPRLAPGVQENLSMTLCVLGRRLALGTMLTGLIPPSLAREDEKSDMEIRDRLAKSSGILDLIARDAVDVVDTVGAFEGWWLMPRYLHSGQSELVKVTRTRSASWSRRSRLVIMWLYSWLQIVDCSQYYIFLSTFGPLFSSYNALSLSLHKSTTIGKIANLVILPQRPVIKGQDVDTQTFLAFPSLMLVYLIPVGTVET